MNVLICNDDGIHAEGIKTLANCATILGDVTVIAPENEMSATAHAITMHSPLRLKEIDMNIENVRAFCVNGTPADCVKLGIQYVMDKKPDLVLSGINHGANLGTDVLYSGTVSAAIEGHLLGTNSVAFSLINPKIGFKSITTPLKKLLKSISIIPSTEKLLININFPQNCKYEEPSCKVTKLGIRRYDENYIMRKDPRGRTYYWLAGEPIEDAGDEDNDISATNKGYISITPLQFDLTSYSNINKLTSLFNKNE